MGVSAFDQLQAKLAARPGVTNPGALAAFIGNKKYGSPTMHRAAAQHESVKAVLRKRRASHGK